MKLKAKFYCDLIMLTSTSSHSYSAIIHFYFFLFKFTLSHQIHDTSPLLIRPRLNYLSNTHPIHFSHPLVFTSFIKYIWISLDQVNFTCIMEWNDIIFSIPVVSDCKMIWDYFIHSTVWNEMDTRAMCSLPLSHIIFF